MNEVEGKKFLRLRAETKLLFKIFLCLSALCSVAKFMYIILLKNMFKKHFVYSNI